MVWTSLSFQTLRFLWLGAPPFPWHYKYHGLEHDELSNVTFSMVWCAIAVLTLQKQGFGGRRALKRYVFYGPVQQWFKNIKNIKHLFVKMYENEHFENKQQAATMRLPAWGGGGSSSFFAF